MTTPLYYRLWSIMQLVVLSLFVLQDNSIVGSVTVSGLTPELDHEYAVKGIKLFLNK